MTAILERRESESLWGRFCNGITSTENRRYSGGVGGLMIPTLLTATYDIRIALQAAPAVDIDGIREPDTGSLLDGHSIMSGAIIPTSAAIGLHFYPLWEAASVDLKFSSLNAITKSKFRVSFLFLRSISENS
jgi:photosystem II P680 reaction center D1 protein